MKRLLVCFLIFAFLFAFSSTAEKEDPLLILSFFNSDPSISSYSQLGHDVSIRTGNFSTIATAIATHDPDIDLFILPSFYGLNQMKSLKYYTPLNDDPVLMNKLSDLYPAFQAMLMNGDDLIGYIIDAQCWSWSVMHPELLEEAGLDAPTTFDELLDVCTALLDSGLLSDSYSLFYEYSYTQEDMMKFFLQQYLIASEVADGQVSFSHPEFVRTVEKIKQTVPATCMEPAEPWDAVFTSISASTQPTTSISYIPTVLDGQSSRLYYIVEVAVINPYSANQAGAQAFLDYLTTLNLSGSFLWDASHNQPHIYDNYDEMIANLKAEIAAYEALDSLTEEDEFMLEGARHDLQKFTDDPYDIHEEDVAYYQSIVENAYVSGDSPVSLDDTLKTLIKRYLAGAFDAEGFARECQQHVNSIYLEMGMDVVNVP